MYTYSCGTPTYASANYATTSGFGSGGFAFILVLFILLAIITSESFFGGGGCYEEKAPCYA